MAAKFWPSASVNAFSTTLNGSIINTDVTITLTTVTSLSTTGGVLVIDRVDANGTSTAALREYISYTGISGQQLTGVTRGLAGSTAQSHNSGAVVEECFSVTHWLDLNTYLAVSHDSAGKIVTSGSATISNIDNNTIIIRTSLYASGASAVLPYPINPVWVIGGGVSLATTSVGKPLPAPQAATFQFFSAVLRTPASGASLILDINKNGTSIFTDQNTRLLISGGGTFVSTASIGTKSITAGDIFTVDIDSGAGSGSDLTILGRAF